MSTPERGTSLVQAAFERAVTVSPDAYARTINAIRTAQPIAADDPSAQALYDSGITQRLINGGFGVSTGVADFVNRAIGETPEDFQTAISLAEERNGRDTMLAIAHRLRENPNLELTAAEAMGLLNLGQIPGDRSEFPYHLVYMSSSGTENQGERYRFSVLAKNLFTAKYRS